MPAPAGPMIVGPNRNRITSACIHLGNGDKGELSRDTILEAALPARGILAVLACTHLPLRALRITGHSYLHSIRHTRAHSLRWLHVLIGGIAK